MLCAGGMGVNRVNPEGFPESDAGRHCIVGARQVTDNEVPNSWNQTGSYVQMVGYTWVSMH